jgi:hypothetical protein
VLNRKTFVLPTRLNKKGKANAHLAHLQASTHKPMLQFAKEPNFCRRSTDRLTNENRKLQDFNEIIRKVFSWI